MKNTNKWIKEFDKLSPSQEEGVNKIVKDFISNLLFRQKQELLREMEEKIISMEIKEPDCHQSHRDLISGYNQALLKVRRYLLRLLNEMKVKK